MHFKGFSSQETSSTYRVYPQEWDKVQVESMNGNETALRKYDSWSLTIVNAQVRNNQRECYKDRNSLQSEDTGVYRCVLPEGKITGFVHGVRLQVDGEQFAS